MKANWSGSEPWFRVGDIVTRDGTDVHRVTETNGDDDFPPDLITVVCVKAPASGWCKVGETEANLARRYSYAVGVIDSTTRLIGGNNE